MGAIADSGVPSELIGHPLVAMAELTRLERDAMSGGGSERTVLVVADRDQGDTMSAFDQVDDLKPLFEVVRERLSRVAIFVFADGLPIEICKGRAPDAPRVEHADPIAVARRGATPAAPKLRITEPPHEVASRETATHAATNDDGEPDDQPQSETAADEAVTRAELEMLLERFEEPGRRDGGPDGTGDSPGQSTGNRGGRR
jgi:hypothetical protein